MLPFRGLHGPPPCISTQRRAGACGSRDAARLRCRLGSFHSKKRTCRVGTDGCKQAPCHVCIREEGLHALISHHLVVERIHHSANGLIRLPRGPVSGRRWVTRRWQKKGIDQNKKGAGCSTAARSRGAAALRGHQAQQAHMLRTHAPARPAAACFACAAPSQRLQAARTGSSALARQRRSPRGERRRRW